MMANDILFIEAENPHNLTKSRYSGSSHFLAYPHLIFKLKIKQKGDGTVVNQYKIKKDGGKNIEFYRKSREICYTSTINKFIKSFQTDNLIKSNDSCMMLFGGIEG